MKKNPIMRTKQYDVQASNTLDIVGQGSIPYARQESVDTPSTSTGKKFSSTGKPAGQMEARGRGAMLRGTTFTVR